MLLNFTVMGIITNATFNAKSISRRTSSASTADTFDRLIFLQLRLRYAAYASRIEICLLGLNAAQAT